MKSMVRFGRRVSLPSTVQILHELRSFVLPEIPVAVEGLAMAGPAPLTQTIVGV